MSKDKPAGAFPKYDPIKAFWGVCMRDFVDEQLERQGFDKEKAQRILAMRARAKSKRAMK